MTQPLDVAVLVGSLRKDSFSGRIGQALIDMAPAELKLETVPIGQLPLYNQDYDAESPAPYAAFRERIKRADALLFVTPEHNRSVPAALKNALDIGSRPYGKSVWAGKPGGVISETPGPLGAFGAHHHLRQVLVAVDVAVLPKPDLYLNFVGKWFDESGKLIDETGLELLKGYLAAYAKWAHRNRAA